MTKLSKRKVKKAIIGSMGIKSIIAKKCNVTRAAITMFLKRKKNKDLLKAIEDERARLVDVAEAKLITKIKEGDFKAIKFFLATQGKERGYFNNENNFNFNKFGIEGAEEIKIEFGDLPKIEDKSQDKIVDAEIVEDDSEDSKDGEQE